MGAITVQRPIVIKTIVTESFKRLYVADLEDAIRRVDAIVQQIDVQFRRFELERQVTPQSRAIRQQLDLERARQEAAKGELQARLREAQELELNSEFTQGTIEGTVDIAVGDNLFDKISRTEVIVKDGIVLEIREAAADIPAPPPSGIITPATR
ncbi:MAG TPA: YlqD family protein [bacterium]|nr:YlqD family protein [bacterium]